MKKNVRYLLLLVVVLCYAFTGGQKSALFPYQDASLPVDKRVADLVGRMTLEEKIMQLDMFWGKEVTDMKGHEATEYVEEKLKQVMGTTGIGSVHDFYPITSELANKVQEYARKHTRLGIPVLFIEEGLHGYEGLGSTSFPAPLQLAAMWDTALVRSIGRVIATESRAHGINMILGPVLCLPRDPRWGRVEETYGEDPYLAALNGVAMVKGLQGSDLTRPDAVIAEPKHFSVHGVPEAGANTSPVNMGEREIRSSFLYVFEKAVREGGALGMMAAYSEIDGIPCVNNKWLLTDVLRVKFLLGLFDHPFIDPALKAKVFHTPESQELALKAAREGICLLKNEGGLLPLNQQVRSVAVVGPLAVAPCC